MTQIWQRFEFRVTKSITKISTICFHHSSFFNLKNHNFCHSLLCRSVVIFFISIITQYLDLIWFSKAPKYRLLSFFPHLRKFSFPARSPFLIHKITSAILRARGKLAVFFVDFNTIRVVFRFHLTRGITETSTVL